MLFGEYAVLLGGEALALPFDARQGRLAYKNDLPSPFEAWFRYLTANLPMHFAEADLAKALDKGLQFDSNIPQGYGLGSSGALCAAVYEAFALQKANDIIEIKNILARMESFFHGASSGIDALVSYLNKPLHIAADGSLEVLSAPKKNSSDSTCFFLIDTGIPRQTSPLVAWFKQKCAQEPAFGLACRNELLPHNRRAIEAFLSQQVETLFDSIDAISRVQWQHFRTLIPEAQQPIWLEGLENRHDFRLKLCGAGGGGFLLGFTTNWRELEQHLSGLALLRLS